jgi:glutamine amidotransferase-like uncharacterized protein
MKNKIELASLVISLSALLLAACGDDSPVSHSAQNGAPDEPRIALYTDQGTWEESVQAAESLFQWVGHPVEKVDADFINRSGLGGFTMLVVPGGDMYQYSQDLSSTGKASIRNFIRSGGSYMGICGGAYFAAEKVIWRGQLLPMQALGLFPGTAEGPINEIVPYPDYGMAELEIDDRNHPITQGRPNPLWILYYWGPALSPDSKGGVAILARSKVGDKPMMVALNYGVGRVFLIATHAEVEEDDDRDGVAFGDELDDQGSDWDLMSEAVHWLLGTTAAESGSS